MPYLLVWDIETVPDLAGFAAANGHDGKTEDEIRAELGWDFAQYLWLPISRANDNDPVAPNRPPSRTVQSGANYAFASRRRAIAALSSMP